MILHLLLSSLNVFFSFQVLNDYLSSRVFLFKLFIAHLNKHIVVYFVGPATFKFPGNAAVDVSLSTLILIHFWLVNRYLLLIRNLLINFLEILISFVCILNLILFLFDKTLFRRIVILLLLLLINTQRNSWYLWHIQSLICFILSHGFLTFWYFLFIHLNGILTINLLFHYQVHCASLGLINFRLSSITHCNVLSSGWNNILNIFNCCVCASLSFLIETTWTCSFMLFLWDRLAVHPSLLGIACLPYDTRPWRVFGIRSSCTVIDVRVICLHAWVYVACVAVAQ